VNVAEFEAVVGAPIAGVHAEPRGVWVSVRRLGGGSSTPIFLDRDDYALLKRCSGLVPAQTHAERLAARRHHRPRVRSSVGPRRTPGRSLPRDSYGSVAANHGHPLCNDRVEASVRLLAARGCFLSRDEIIAHVRNGGVAPDEGSSSDPVTVADQPLPRQVRGRLVTLLMREGVEEKTARFVLEGGTGSPALGAARNASLLLTAGRRAILVNQTFTPSFTATERFRHGVMLHGSFDPCEYSCEEQREADPERSDGNPQLRLTISELLGRHLGTVLANCEPIEIHSDITPPALDALITYGPSLRIAAVLPGVSGCARIPLFSWIRTLGTPAPEEPDHSRSAPEGRRRCVRRTPGTVLSLGAFFDGACIGFDNRQLSVPFHPDSADCDDLFGVMLRLSAPDACVAHVPELTVAGRGGVATPDLSSVLTQLRPGMGRLIGEVLGRAQPAAGVSSVDDWCGYMGAVLEAVANGSRDEFLELAYECAHSYWFTAHDQIADLLDGAQRPSTKQCRALRGVRRELRRLLGSPSEAVPSAGPGAANYNHAVDAARRSMSDFARLLQAWPAVWSAAARLPESEREVLAAGCG
jgi:hypothetical protein